MSGTAPPEQCSDALMPCRTIAHSSRADVCGFTDGEREATMLTRPDDACDVCCHVKNCEQMATARCMHCGHPCCAAHIHLVTITRRDEKRPPGMSPIVRLPIRTETYALCSRCSTKPVPWPMPLSSQQ